MEFLNNPALWEFINVFSYFVLGYFLTINGVYLALVIISFFYLRKFNKKKIAYEGKGLFKTDAYKSVSIIVPAFNEESSIIESLKSLLQVDFNDFEVIVVNDGSTDKTLELLKDEYQLVESDLVISDQLESKPVKKIFQSQIHENLIVVDKENGKRADAVNAGVNTAHKDLICTIDADSWLEQDVLKKMLFAFVEDDDTVGVGGIIRVSNGCEFENHALKQIKLPGKFVPRVQVLEYIRSFLFGRIGWDKLNSLLIISGAFGVFDRKAVLEVGGYDVDSLGEDFELTVKLHRYHRENDIDYNIKFLPEPVCWTEVPENWSDLSKQRNRWHRGLIGTIVKHRKMLFNPKYGSPGLLGLPFYLIFEFLGPVIEFIGYIVVIVMMITGYLNPTFAFLFLAIAIFFGMILSLSSVASEEMTYRQYPRVKDSLRLTGLALIENLGYRQLHTWWRVKGIVDYLRGKTEWGTKREVKISDRLIQASHWIWLVIANIAIGTLAWMGLS